MCTDDRPRRAAVGVPDRVGAALGDAGEQRLGRKRPLDARSGREAVSGDSAHSDSMSDPDAPVALFVRLLGRAESAGC